MSDRYTVDTDRLPALRTGRSHSDWLPLHRVSPRFYWTVETADVVAAAAADGDDAAQPSMPYTDSPRETRMLVAVVRA